MRIGTGWDIHKLITGRPLILGGVVVPYDKGEDGHSDGDVLIHAVIDSILGAVSMGDIGTHFPPSDPAFKNIKSIVLLEKVMDMVHREGFHIVNVDTTVILEQPKLKEYIFSIRKKLSSVLGITVDLVSVKAKTKEKLDAVGQGKAVEAYASVLLEETGEDVWV